MQSRVARQAGPSHPIDLWGSVAARAPVDACLQARLALCCLLGQVLEVTQQLLLVRHLYRLHTHKHTRR